MLSRFWSHLEIHRTTLQEALSSCKPTNIFAVLDAKGIKANRYLKDLMSYTELWQVEVSNFTTFRQPWNRNYSIPLHDLVQHALDENKFNCWASILSWCFCAKCGRRLPNPDTHCSTPRKTAWSCRSCDLSPDIMEKDKVSLKLHAIT